MFRRPLCCSVTLLALSAGALGFLLKQSGVNVSSEYDAYVLPQVTTPLPARAHTHRHNVCKTLYHVGASDLAYRLQSDRSTLTVDPDGKVFEQMEGVEGVFQEKHYFSLSPQEQRSTPMQTLRKFVARSALFDYATQQLHAETVDLVRVEAPGHRLPNHAPDTTDVSVQVRADSLMIEMGQEGKLKCGAKRLHATFCALPSSHG